MIRAYDTHRVRVFPEQKLVRIPTHHRYPIHDGVEALAVSTLHAKEVPRPIHLHLLAVVAHDRDDLAQFRRYRLERDAHRHGVPRRLHPLMGLGRLLAHGTPAVMTRKLSKAVPVYGVPARELMTRVPARKEVLLADGTVAHVFAQLAVVVREELPVDAHPAVHAVAKVLAPPYPTEPAIRTVVGTLLVRHPKVAYCAVILTKLDITVGAEVAECRKVWFEVGVR